MQGYRRDRLLEVRSCFKSLVASEVSLTKVFILVIRVRLIPSLIEIIEDNIGMGDVEIGLMPSC